MNKISAFLILLVIGLACFFARPVLSEKTSILEISPSRDRGFDYLDISTSGYVEAKGVLLEDQLIINFPNAGLAKELKLSNPVSKRIKNITVRQTDHQAQVIVELKKDSDYDIVNVFGKNKSVIEISDRIDYTAKLMAAWEKENLKNKGQELKPYKYEPASKGKHLSLRKKIIVLDPGHGGNDPGSFSKSGIPEKVLTLQTTRQIALLLKSAGATVYLTRNEDRRSNLKDIADFANRSGADIFISVHYNSTYRDDISGTETYYYNAVSRGFARILHQNLIEILKEKDRGLRRVMFYTVNHTEMPSALIEPLYLSSTRGEKRAEAPAFQHKVAEAILKGVVEYFRSRRS